MISTLTTNDLTLLAAETLGQAAFLLSEPAPDAPLPSHGLLVVEIGFEGEVQGRLVIAAASRLATQMAADMLCIDASDEEAATQASGALAELANVLAGVLVPRIFGSDGRWALGLPRVVRGRTPHAATEQAVTATLLSDSGHPLRVELVLGRAAA